MNLGNHSEHCMVRMTQPIESGYHGRWFAHDLRKFMKKTVQHCKEDEHRYTPHKHKQTSYSMCSTVGKFGPFDLSVINILENFIIDTCTVLSGKNYKVCHKQKWPKEPSAEAIRHSFLQLLKIVKDNILDILQFLNLFGINVTMMTDNDFTKKPTDNAQMKASMQKPELCAFTFSKDSTKKFPSETKKLRDEPVNTAGAPLTDNASLQKESATATFPEQAVEAEEWSMIQCESSNISHASSSLNANGTMPKEMCPAYV
ncbi:uncharacterized protein LOC118647063 [Monomorium pharaonis]|uniref:uncharacterized protein LOC118647063 n=1 Tax=Monomorium pharaonis TaxID=307658 RepID=UPI0017474A4A|nr:uncharacterized protein LOC118647063 [Monomorium pharaonis]XP_036147152.1 uncharacterized protein LOC118647063 [Monomorium pharaonis]